MTDKTVDWGKVENRMRRSIRGTLIDQDAAEKLFYRALAEDPKRYRALHAQLKQEAATEMNPLAKKP